MQLETDTSLLVPKARAALERYGHQVVIGNELHRRKFEVVFVSRGTIPGPSSTSSAPIPTPAQSGSGLGTTISSPADSAQTRDLSSGEITETWLRLDENSVNAGKEIEEDIIDELVRMHSAWIERAAVEAVASST